jgi:hypothetical protein
MNLVKLASNFSELSIGDRMIWFSYETPIGFTDGVRRVVRKNAWGPTTGKHLNKIDGGSKIAIVNRLTSEEFENRLMEIFGEKEKGDKVSS